VVWKVGYSTNGCQLERLAARDLMELAKKKRGEGYMECLGCRISNGIEPNLIIIYENELITCVLDIAPFNEGHILILPKKHYWDVDEIDQETAYNIMDTYKCFQLS